jgi:hypothetical protein
MFIYLFIFQFLKSLLVRLPNKKRYANEADFCRIGTSRKNQESVDVLKSQ